ncbi:cytidylyltransferase domain-containing protein [Photobacterium nomapromontoriensis]|uniref:acylneuraminate cytidylyltransferase family protein n=1 Tax=Photobacterium nomapromontoriensis TaxID=2910237 RepID=UPI003D0D6247
MIAIIPARGGSKGLPGKNIKLINGKPLIAYTIEAALQSKYITDVIVSTDDNEIYKTALKFGVKDTFLRPKELAQDDSFAIDNYNYTIDRLRNEFGMSIDAFIVLQPTSPLRNVSDIDNAIELFFEKNADSVISYTEEQHPVVWHKYINNIGKLENIFNDDFLKNRQEIRTSYYPNGAIYLFKSDLIKSGRYYSNNTYPFLMPRSRSVDIDTIEDFEYARFLMKGRNELHLFTE